MLFSKLRGRSAYLLRNCGDYVLSAQLFRSRVELDKVGVQLSWVDVDPGTGVSAVSHMTAGQIEKAQEMEGHCEAISGLRLRLGSGCLSEVIGVIR